MNASIATVVILAAGLGTRMRSATPKVLHTVCGLPLLTHVLRAVDGLYPRTSATAGDGSELGRSAVAAEAPRIVVVLGHGQEQVVGILPEGCLTAVQEQQLGTGHALLSAAAHIRGGVDGPMLVLPGDTPLVTTDVLRGLIDAHSASGADATVLTMHLADPTGYGRVVRCADRTAAQGVAGGVQVGNGGADVARIVEHCDATEDERRVDEVNSGMYVLPAWRSLEILAGLGAANAQGEVYLTDVVEKLRSQGGRVGAVVTPDPRACLGVNSRVELAQAQAIMNERICRNWMLAGVTLDDPGSTQIDARVTLEPDTRVLPFTCLRGGTTVARGSEIGPGTTLVDTIVGPDCRVLLSYGENSVVEAGSRVGPFTHIRPAQAAQDHQ